MTASSRPSAPILPISPAPTWDGKNANPIAENMVSTFKPAAGSASRSVCRTAASCASGGVADRTTNWIRCWAYRTWDSGS